MCQFYCLASQTFSATQLMINLTNVNLVRIYGSKVAAAEIIALLSDKCREVHSSFVLSVCWYKLIYAQFAFLFLISPAVSGSGETHCSKQNYIRYAVGFISDTQQTAAATDDCSSYSTPPNKMVLITSFTICFAIVAHSLQYTIRLTQ